MSIDGNALQAAALADLFSIVKFLVKYGANVNAAANGRYGNALRTTLIHDHTEMTEFLLAEGADASESEGLATYGASLTTAVRWYD